MIECPWCMVVFASPEDLGRHRVPSIVTMGQTRCLSERDMLAGRGDEASGSERADGWRRPEDVPWRKTHDGAWTISPPLPGEDPAPEHPRERPMLPLEDVIDFERRRVGMDRQAVVREIYRRFEVTPARYFQMLDRHAHTPEAMAAAPEIFGPHLRMHERHAALRTVARVRTEAETTEPEDPRQSRLAI